MNQDFLPCIVIPVFNHGQLLGRTLEALSRYGLFCIVVDDGSDLENRNQVQRSAQQYPWVKMLRMERNKGKGAAVMRGFCEASELGYSHVLQIDADGQHEVSDIPRFLEEARANPDCLILGFPQFDSSAPRLRLWGRELSKWWVWALSAFKLRCDPLCGFRLYPLKASHEVLQGCKIGERMDFDVEIVVRLSWSGVPVRNLSTKVVYPESGTSHFRMLHDNVRFISLYLRLLLNRIWRWSRQLGAAGDAKAREWFLFSERGSILGLRLMFVVYRSLGYRVCSMLLYPIAAYFFLTGGKARRAMFSYLEVVSKTSQGQATYRGHSRSMAVYLQFVEFARAILDKVAVWLGDIANADLTWENHAEFSELLERKQGGILLSAHLGNLEVTRALSENVPGLTINAITFIRHAERFNNFLKEIHPGSHIRLVKQEAVSPDLIIDLQNRVRAGEFVALNGDRAVAGASNRVLPLPFLGQMAPFPEGPLVLASLLQCPVYLFFCLRVGLRKYQIFYEEFADKIDLPRKDRSAHLKAYLERYAARLEHYCLKAPRQWFNFYEFWYKEGLQTEQHLALERSAEF